MTSETKFLECDYLVIGAGATGIAFVDEILWMSRGKNVKVILVDKRAKPGGHWVDSYSFVRLHQPAAWYGVNSRALGIGGADLSSKAQILSYYELVIEDFISSGRFSYFPQCEYLGDGNFRSLLDENLMYHVKVLRKIVDATLMITHVPATKSPEYKVSEKINLIPINCLADIKRAWKRYVVIGAGKTGIDALLFLIDNRVNPEKISWIVPNDSWYLCRDKFEDLDNLSDSFCDIMDNVIASKDVNEVYLRGEKLGHYLRLDKNIWPTKMRAATMSTNEINKIKSVHQIIRKGRINYINENSIVFKNGEIVPTDENTLHIDCSTAGSKFPPVKEKIFDGNTINLQMVQIPPSCTSAAMIAALELSFPTDEAKKNSLCKPFNAPQLPSQWFELNLLSNINGYEISRCLGISWMRSSRLTPLYHMSYYSFLKMMIYTTWNRKTINAKLKMFAEQADLYGKFEK